MTQMAQTAEDRSQLEPALELVAPHCDILDRLPLVPPSAQVRGVFFGATLSVLRNAGKLDQYLEYFPSDKFSVARMFPLRDYMTRLAVGGACLRSPEEVHLGMQDICRAHSVEFSKSLLGRILVRVLSRDPVRLTEQGLAARRQTCTYGHWSIKRLAERCIEMTYQEEYVWIESAIAGGAIGTFESCGIEAQVETTLDGRFDGATRITW